MTPSERVALCDKLILAVRPHGMLAESVLEPLQTLRDDLKAESPVPAPQPVQEPSRAAPADTAKPVATAPSQPPLTAPAKDAK